MKGKKLIAFLLAIFMLAGILPAAPGGLTASASGDLEVIVDFREVYDSAAADQDGDGSYVAVNPVYETHGWNFNTSKTVAHYLGDGNVGVRTGAADNSVTSCSSWLQINMAVKTSPNDITFNIDAKTAGTYDFSMDAHHFSLGAELLIYVNDEYVGTVNTRSGTANAINTTSFGKVYLKQGENTVTFTRDGGEYQFLLQKLSFTNGIAEASYGFDKVVLTPAKLTLNKGDTMTVKGGVLMTNGVYKIMNGAYNPGVNGTYQWESVAKKNICELISSDAAVGTVEAVGSTSAGELTYTFTALSAGATTLTMAAKIDGVDKTAKVRVNVVDPNATNPADIPIDLTAAITDGDYHPITETVEADGWGINKEMTVANYYGAGNGERISDSNTAALCSSFIDLRMDTGENPNDFTIDIYAPQAGTYDFTMNCYQLATYGSEVAVFVNEENAGHFTTNAAPTGHKDFPLKRVWLNQGINTVTFTRLGGGVQFLPKKLMFTNGVAGDGYEYDKTVLTPEKTVLKVGETMTVKGGALMTNGEYRWMNDVAFTGVDSKYLWESVVQKNICSLASSNTDVGTVEAVGSTTKGELTYTFTAKSAGKTTLTLTTKVDGVDKTVTKVINVIGEIPAIFGNTYAYIREVNDGRNTAYKLVLVGAIDSLDYKEVGFKAYNEAIGTLSEGTTQVYNKITVGGNDYTPANFGIANGGYIFTVEYDVPSAAAAMSVDFWAYAIANDDNGTEIEGGKRVISSLAKAQ